MCQLRAGEYLDDEAHSGGFRGKAEDEIGRPLPGRQYDERAVHQMSDTTGDFNWPARRYWRWRGGLLANVEQLRFPDQRLEIGPDRKVGNVGLQCPVQNRLRPIVKSLLPAAIATGAGRQLGG